MTAILTDRLHMTLQGFGDIRLTSAADLTRLLQSLASLAVEPFSIRLDRVSGNALVGSRSRAVRDFQRAMIHHLARRDIYVPDYAFDPHVSLTYGDWQARNIAVPPISWPVDELLLITSVHGTGHRLIDRWPLISRQGLLDL